MIAGSPGSTRMSLSMAVLNPLNETWTEYKPGFNAGTLNVPLPSVTALNALLVALLVTTTVAPGMTAPALSTTVPDSVPEACAKTVEGTERPTRTNTIHKVRTTLMRETLLQRKSNTTSRARFYTRAPPPISKTLQGGMNVVTVIDRVVFHPTGDSPASYW